jgi:hypothetical protein
MALSNSNVKPQPKANRHWHMPNYLAQTRLLAGGDWRTAFLLYRIIQVWRGTPKRLSRCGKEWVAMPRGVLGFVFRPERQRKQELRASEAEG